MPKSKSTKEVKSNFSLSNINLKVLLNKKKKALSLKVNRKNKKAIVVSVSMVALAALLYMNKGLLLVATVNGVPITRLSLVKEVENLYGQQVLEDLITKEIIRQEVKSAGIEIAQHEIDGVISNLEQTLSQQGTTLDVALAMQGQTRESLEENVKIQKSLERLLADKVNVTEEAVLGYFDDNSDFYQGQDFESVKQVIKDQMTQEQLSTEVATWLAEKKSSADIKYFNTK